MTIGLYLGLSFTLTIYSHCLGCIILTGLMRKRLIEGISLGFSPVRSLYRWTSVLSGTYVELGWLPFGSWVKPRDFVGSLESNRTLVFLSGIGTQALLPFVAFAMVDPDIGRAFSVYCDTLTALLRLTIFQASTTEVKAVILGSLQAIQSPVAYMVAIVSTIMLTCSVPLTWSASKPRSGILKAGERLVTVFYMLLLIRTIPLLSWSVFLSYVVASMLSSVVMVAVVILLLKLLDRWVVGDDVN